MSKITFRAADDLVERLEALDTSKSEVMREALRRHLDEAERSEGPSTPDEEMSTTDHETVDDVLQSRIDELVTERVDELLADRAGPTEQPLTPARDVNVNISVDGDRSEPSVNADSEASHDERDRRKTPGDGSSESAYTREQSCEKCGEELSSDHVYCPNCGEKATHRVFCECGDELRSDWAFCPGCGRRTSAADVLERS